ncbi:MAG: hypothetical protein MUO40_08965 [Anaerolineaceae bacterium]|nr:hypothetical protein [Anaerolineaceae bacterium]
MKNQLLSASICGSIATFSLPANADIIPGQFVPDPDRPDWNGVNVKYDNSDQQVLGGAGPEIIYDIPLTGYDPIAAKSIYENWNGAPENWKTPGIDIPFGSYDSGGGGRPDTNGDGKGGSCERTENRPPFCDNILPNPPNPPVPQPDVPGPLPLLGLAAAFGFSRKLRNRIK